MAVAVTKVQSGKPDLSEFNGQTLTDIQSITPRVLPGGEAPDPVGAEWGGRWPVGLYGRLLTGDTLRRFVENYGHSKEFCKLESLMLGLAARQTTQSFIKAVSGLDRQTLKDMLLDIRELVTLRTLMRRKVFARILYEGDLRDFTLHSLPGDAGAAGEGQRKQLYREMTGRRDTAAGPAMKISFCSFLVDNQERRWWRSTEIQQALCSGEPPSRTCLGYFALDEESLAAGMTVLTPAAHRLIGTSWMSPSEVAEGAVSIARLYSASVNLYLRELRAALSRRMERDGSPRGKFDPKAELVWLERAEAAFSGMPGGVAFDAFFKEADNAAILESFYDSVSGCQQPAAPSSTAHAAHERRQRVIERAADFEQIAHGLLERLELQKKPFEERVFMPLSQHVDNLKEEFSLLIQSAREVRSAGERLAVKELFRRLTVSSELGVRDLLRVLRFRLSAIELRPGEQKAAEEMLRQARRQVSGCAEAARTVLSEQGIDVQKRKRPARADSGE